jgi:hypothetical protein
LDLSSSDRVRLRPPLTSTANGNTFRTATVRNNTGDGFLVDGSGNTIRVDRIYSNGGNGLETTASATSTTIKNVQSNTGASVSSTENGGAEYLLGVAAINGDSNKADALSIPSAGKCPTFPAAGPCEKRELKGRASWQL